MKNRRKTLLAGLVVVVAAVAVWLWLGSGSHTEAGIDLWVNGDYEPAVKILERSMGADDDPRLPYFAGLCHRGLKNWDRAIEYFLLLRPNREYASRALYQQVLTNVDAKRLEDARKIVQKEVNTTFRESALAHEASGLYHMAQVQAVLENIHDRLAEVIGDSSARRYDAISLRIVYAASAVYDRSLDSLLKRLDERHGFSDTLPLRVLFDRGHKELISAFNAFDRAIRLWSTNPAEPAPLHSRWEIAEVYKTRGRTGEAQEQLKAIIASQLDEMRDDKYFERARNGLQFDSRNELADVLMRQSKYSEALDVLKDAAEMYPDTFAIEEMMAECYAALGKNDRMLSLAAKWLRKDPRIPSLNYLKGKHHFDRNEFKQAVIYIDRAHARRPSYRPYATLLARCYAQLKEHIAADRLLDNLIQLEPNEHEHYILRAEAMEGLNWRDETRKFLVRALRSKFSDRNSTAHKDLREWLDGFIERHDLLPKDLFTAAKLYSEDPLNFKVALRYLELLTSARNWSTGERIAGEVARNCRETDREYFDAMLACARFEAERENWATASDYYGRAASARPYDAAPFLGQCRCNVELAQLGKAWEALRKAELFDRGTNEAMELRFRLHVQDHEFEEAATVGEKLLTSRPRDARLLKEVARAYIEVKRDGEAKKVLDRLANLPDLGQDQIVELARMQFKVGDRSKADKLLIGVVRADYEDLSRALEIGRLLFANERYRAVIDALTPVADVNPEGAIDAIKLMTRSWKALGETDRMLEGLSRVFDLGGRTWSYTEMVQFCLDHGAYEEALSIINAAVEGKIATTGLLLAAVDTAIDWRRPEKAERYLRLLNREPGSEAYAIGVAEAKVKLARGQVAAAMSAVRSLLANATPAQARELRFMQVDALGRAGMIDEMGTEVLAAVQTLEDPSGLAARAGRYLMMADHADAPTWIDQAIAQDGPSAEARLDRGLLHVEAGRFDEAWVEFEAAWALSKDEATAHARALCAAFLRNREAMNRVLRRRRGDTWDLWSDTEATANFLISFPGSRAAERANALPHGSAGERDAFLVLLAAAVKDHKTAAFTRAELARYFIFRNYEHTVRKAVKATEVLAEKIPEQKPALDFLGMRALLRSELEFNRAIRKATERLTDSDLEDETALLIYAESYSASRARGSLQTLIEYAKKNPTRFSQTYFRDLARILEKAGYYQDAAELLHSSPERSAEKDLRMAVALYRANNVGRAGRLLLNRQKELAARPEFGQIVGHFLARDPETARQGFRMVREVVYRRNATDPSAHLSLAFAAFALGDDVEGEKNVRKYLIAHPASARAVMETIRIVEPHASRNIDLLEWLETRRSMLDPSQQVALVR